MASQSVAAKNAIRDFIDKNFLMGVGGLRYQDTDSFIAKGIIDSTGVLELVAFIQQAFGITVEDAELVPENLDSVNNISNFISRKTPHAG